MELRIRDVSKTYPNGVRALKQVNLTIPCGLYGLPAEPDLEDVCFSTMAGHIGRRREHPEPEVAP